MSSVTVTPTNDFKDASFNYQSGSFSIVGKYQLINNDIKNKNFASHYVEGITEADFGRVSLSPERNRVIFNFLDYQDKEYLFKRVSSIKLDFTADDETITLDGLYPKNGTLTVNYSSIESLQGKNVKVSMTI